MADTRSESLVILGERRRGRPMRAEAPSSPLPIRLSPDERETVRLAAKCNHQTQSAFIRDALVTAAAECLEAIRITKP